MTTHQRIMQRMLRMRADDSLPVSIEHQRIYILPTRRGWAFLSSLLIMLVASINYGLSLGFALCFLLTGLFAAALLHTYRNLAGITVVNIGSDHAFHGDALKFNLAIRNSSALDRIGISIATLDGQTKMDLPPEETTRAVLNIKTMQRGRQSLGRLTLSSDFPLGLWRTWSYIHVSVDGLVFPRPENNPPPLPVVANDSDGKVPNRRNQGDVCGLRDYQPGDPLTAIAWKTAARGQGLHVRTFEEDSSGSQVTLTLSATCKTDVEAQLSRLTAWVLDAESRRADFSVQLADHMMPIGQGAAHRLEALTLFALYPSTAQQ